MSHADPQVTAPPVEAFTFKGGPAKLSKPDASGRRNFEVVFYSGDKIANHWFWGDLVFDIGSTKAKPRTGVLLNHKSDQIVGSGECKFGDDMRCVGQTSASSEYGKFVADQADEGFPWEASHFIEPGEIDQIKSGVKVSVNGREFTGPLTIFRNNLIREVSFCATGADYQTSATVFNKAQHQGVPAMSAASDKTPTIEELQATVTRLSADIETVKKANATQAAEIATFRKSQVNAMFAARGEKFADDAARDTAAKPFLDMPAEAFVAAIKYGTPAKAATATQPNHRLFSAEDAGGESEGGAERKPGSLVARVKQMHAQPAAAK
jgi:hypothetical protein